MAEEHLGQAVWTGTINFGLVSIPVRLHPATQPKDVRFHLYDRRSGKRVHYERVIREYEPAAFSPDPSSAPPGETAFSGAASRVDVLQSTPAVQREDQSAPSQVPIDRSDIVRGIELPSGDFVTVTEDELDLVAPERSRSIDIEEFVDLAEIDPVFFEKSYYVAPARGLGAEKPYLLLLRAMQAANMVGVGRFVLRTKPHLVAIRPLANALALETLFFADEVRQAEEIGRLPQIQVSDRELTMARELITALATDWVPEKHGDVYREELLELLRSKPATPRSGAGRAPPSVGDLIAALKASVEAAKRTGDARARPRSKKAG